MLVLHAACFETLPPPKKIINQLSRLFIFQNFLRPYTLISRTFQDQTHFLELSRSWKNEGKNPDFPWFSDVGILFSTDLVQHAAWLHWLMSECGVLTEHETCAVSMTLTPTQMTASPTLYAHWVASDAPDSPANDLTPNGKDSHFSFSLCVTWCKMLFYSTIYCKQMSGK